MKKALAPNTSAMPQWIPVAPRTSPEGSSNSLTPGDGRASFPDQRFPAPGPARHSESENLPWRNAANPEPEQMRNARASWSVEKE